MNGETNRYALLAVTFAIVNGVIAERTSTEYDSSRRPANTGRHATDPGRHRPQGEYPHASRNEHQVLNRDRRFRLMIDPSTERTTSCAGNIRRRLQ
jgi:hypothetical protein